MISHGIPDIVVLPELTELRSGRAGLTKWSAEALAAVNQIALAVANRLNERKQPPG
ncbi:hypothetical protein [Streptomyces sp. CAU 1734]|uniref:hypothetical protein n=1 Tax=Streptomyces sp. CAU 1734 TaxID=3140360 RepID=UPI00326024EB